MAQVRQFKAGEVIFEEAADCDGAYIVTGGLVGIHASSDSGSIELARVGKGGMFGEMATIDLQQRSAGARALEDTTVVHLDRTEFGQRLQELPIWALLLVQMLVRRLRVTNEMLMAATSELTALNGKVPGASDIHTADDKAGGLVGEEDIHPDTIIAEMDSAA